MKKDAVDPLCQSCQSKVKTEYWCFLGLNQCEGCEASCTLLILDLNGSMKKNICLRARNDRLSGFCDEWWVMVKQILGWSKFLDFKMALFSVAVMFSLYQVLKYEKDEGCFACFYPALLHSAGRGEHWNRKDCKTYWSNLSGKNELAGIKQQHCINTKHSNMIFTHIRVAFSPGLLTYLLTWISSQTVCS